MDSKTGTPLFLFKCWPHIAGLISWSLPCVQSWINMFLRHQDYLQTRLSTQVSERAWIKTEQNSESWMRAVVISGATTSCENSLGWLHYTVTHRGEEQENMQLLFTFHFLNVCIYTVWSTPCSSFSSTKMSRKSPQFCLKMSKAV